MKTNWNLKLLYKSINDPQIEKDIQISKKKITNFVKKWKETTKYINDPKTLKEALDEYEMLFSSTGICDKPSYYLILLNNLDQTDTNIKGKLNKLNDITTKLSNDIQFFELNIAKIEKEKQKKFLTSSLLKDYKHFLESLFKSSLYLLSDKEEKIFNLTSKTSYSNWADMLSELLDKQNMDIIDEEGKKKNITYNEIFKYLDSKNKKVRDYASKEFNKINEKYLEIAEFEINSILESKKINDEYRGVPRPDFLRHLSDDIDTEVVDTLVKVVTENFDISKKYYTKKAKFLGQKKLGYYERNVPAGEIEKEYTFEEGIKLVKKSFKDIDAEFLNSVNKFIEKGHYDVFPKKSKSGGGFCITINKNLPTYILLNHNNKLNDVLTIAHESGHGIHSEMSKKQNSLNSGYPTSLAEVASTFFEDFVLEEILNTADENLKFNILAQKLNSDISSIFRQVAFYNFEKELHSSFKEKGYLNKEYISDLFCKHMKAYLGDSVKEDEGMRSGWIYVSHFRRFFYVYSYASGLLISKALQRMFKGDKRNVRYIKEFLSSGSTKSPLELFRGMGIDITKPEFWQYGISETNDLLELL